MDDRRLNFGPRYDANLNWVCEDGSPAHADDVGLAITCIEDEGLTFIISGTSDWRTWQLTPQQAGELVAFLYDCGAHRGG